MLAAAGAAMTTTSDVPGAWRAAEGEAQTGSESASLTASVSLAQHLLACSRWVTDASLHLQVRCALRSYACLTRGKGRHRCLAWQRTPRHRSSQWRSQRWPLQPLHLLLLRLRAAQRMLLPPALVSLN